MTTILYFRGLESQFSRKLTGIIGHARERDWDVRVVPACRAAAMARRFVRLWHADGCIVNCGPGTNDLPAGTFGALPVVYIDRPAHRLRPTDSCIYHDSSATARLAADELLSLGCANHLYVGYDAPNDWDVERERAYAEALAARGMRCHVLRLNRSKIRLGDVRRLSAWLGSFDGPRAVFAAADVVSEQVVEACRLARLDIPDDVAIIGVDNDLNICEHSIPSLSSIEPDFVLAGRESAKALERLMRGDGQPTRRIYGPLQLVRRESTRRIATADRGVASALELIRRKACDGLTVPDVALCFACSRRMAEIRFRNATGHTISDEIKARRIEKAKELLSETRAKISAVANFCGYNSDSAFIHVFAKAVGRTPAQWSADHATGRSSGR